MDYPRRVTICEVGPRDGFQMEREFIPTGDKIAIIDALSQTQLREIQVTSFVHPAAIPQLLDAEEVFARIVRVPGVRYSALVANLKGAQRAVAAEVDAIDIVVSATDSHSLSNTNLKTHDAMRRVATIVELGRHAGVEVTIGFATALGCPFEGLTPYHRVEQLVQQAVEHYGIDRILVADTVGMASPKLVYETIVGLRSRFPSTTFGLHLHDTRRMGLANVLAGLEAGVVRFDSSIAGLGGCPYAPGATGNIATEDLVNMLGEMGIETGVDLERLTKVGERVHALVGHADSGVQRAGTSRRQLGAFNGNQVKVG